MKGIDIIQQIKLGEVSKVQFKERILDNYDIGCELLAFGNARISLDTDLDTKLKHSHSDSDTNLDTIRSKLTNKQRDIVNFCSVPRSSKEILGRVGLTNHSKNRQTYIMSLVETGYLEMTNPEHPNASNQKYRKRKK